MLVIEKFSNGRTIISIKPDWHPNRIGKAYVPPLRNLVTSTDALRLQRALLSPRRS